METPKKLYFGEADKSVLDIYSTKEHDDEVEYIRKDAFIEKACQWLKDNTDRYLYNTGKIDEYKPKCGGKMIEDFKKYMEE